MDGANFCPKCGTAVVRDLHCSACQAVVSADDRFCAACGAPQHASHTPNSSAVTQDVECRNCEHFREAELIEPRLPREMLSDVVSEAHSELTQKEADFAANESAIRNNLIAANQTSWGQKPFASSFCAEHAGSERFDIWEVKNRVKDCASFRRRASQLRNDCFGCARRTSHRNPYLVLNTLRGKDLIAARRKDLEQQEATEIKSVFARRGHTPSQILFHDTCQYFSTGRDYVAVPYPNQHYDCIGFEPEPVPVPAPPPPPAAGDTRLTADDWTAFVEAAAKLAVSFAKNTDEAIREQLTQLVRSARRLQDASPARAAFLMTLANSSSGLRNLDYPERLTQAEQEWCTIIPDHARILCLVFPMMFVCFMTLQKQGGQPWADEIRQTILEECILMRITPAAMTAALNQHRILLREGIYIEAHRGAATKAIKVVEDHIRRQELEARGNPNFDVDAMRSAFAVYSLPPAMERIAEYYESLGVGRGLFAYQPCDDRQEEGLRIMVRGDWMYSRAEALFLFQRHMEHLLTIDQRLLQYWQAVDTERNALGMDGPVTRWLEPVSLFEFARAYNFALLHRLKRQFGITDDVPVGIESWIKKTMSGALKKEHPAIYAILWPTIDGGWVTALPLQGPQT